MQGSDRHNLCRAVAIAGGLWLAGAALLVAARAEAEDASFEAGRAAYVAGDYARARALWLEQAETGDARSQFGLGTLYHEGSGVAPDPAAATRWFRLAAEQGYAPAQFNLGNAYRRGEGVPQSDEQANAWWIKAAEQEFAPAQYNLATQYFYGRGVPADRAIALIYYRRAAENGHRGARRVLAELEAQMESGEVAAIDAPPSPPAPAAPPSPPAPATPAPETSPAAAAESADWIAAQDPAWYTLQLAALPTEASAREYIEQHDWRAPVSYFGFTRGGKRYYPVFYGAYPSLGAAEAAAAELPEAVRQAKPWVRRIKSVHRQLRGEG